MWYNYLWWIPLVVLFYVGYALLSLKNNASSDLKWLFLLYAYGGFIQLWAIVSKISKNLIFDNFLYDFLMTLSVAVTLVIMKSAVLTPVQICGIFICIIGLVLLR
jgi:hypothetical protein